MSFRTKFFLSFIALVLLIAAYFLDDFLEEKRLLKKMESTHALYFHTNDVLDFSFQNQNGTFSFKRTDKNAPWTCTQRPQMNVDQSAVNELLSALPEISIQQVAQNSHSQIDDGLQHPALSIQIGFKNHDTKNLLVGNAIQIGQTSAGTLNPLSVYAKSTSHKETLIVDATFKQLFQSKNIAHFYSKQLSRMDGHLPSQITVDHIDHKIVLKKDHDLWHVESSAFKNADQTFIKSYVQRFQMLMAEKIYTPEEVKSYGIDYFGIVSPAAVITFDDEKGKKIQTFSLGLTKYGIFIASTDGSIGQLPLDDWTDLVPAQIQFLNRTVFLDKNMDSIKEIRLEKNHRIQKSATGWSGSANQFVRIWKTLQADELITGVSAAELPLYGISNPLTHFSFVFDEPGNPNIEISVGSRVPRNEKSIYVKRSDSSVVYAVNADWLSELAKMQIEAP